jgi:hypothetical protein
MSFPALQVRTRDTCASVGSRGFSRYRCADVVSSAVDVVVQAHPSRPRTPRRAAGERIDAAVLSALREQDAAAMSGGLLASMAASHGGMGHSTAIAAAAAAAAAHAAQLQLASRHGHTTHGTGHSGVGAGGGAGGPAAPPSRLPPYFRPEVQFPMPSTDGDYWRTRRPVVPAPDAAIAAHHAAVDVVASLYTASFAVFVGINRYRNKVRCARIRSVAVATARCLLNLAPRAHVVRWPYRCRRASPT